MTQRMDVFLFALSEIRATGYITASTQMRLIGMDINPEYVRRECTMWLDEEAEMNDLPSGSQHITSWAANILDGMSAK